MHHNRKLLLTKGSGVNGSLTSFLYYLQYCSTLSNEAHGPAKLTRQLEINYPILKNKQRKYFKNPKSPNSLLSTKICLCGRVKFQNKYLIHFALLIKPL